jgi:hypothetical protein
MLDLPVNPLRQYRSDKFLSLDQAAAELKVSVSTLIRTEQGCYNDIPPTILGAISSHFLSPDAVRSQYSRYQTGNRTLNSRGLVRGYQRELSQRYRISRKTKNPFIIFRELQGYYSRLAFCKDFCLHPATVKRLEDGLANRIPESVQSALVVGDVLTEDDIEFIETLYQDWLERNII